MWHCAALRLLKYPSCRLKLPEAGEVGWRGDFFVPVLPVGKRLPLPAPVAPSVGPETMTRFSQPRYYQKHIQYIERARQEEDHTEDVTKKNTPHKGMNWPVAPRGGSRAHWLQSPFPQREFLCSYWMYHRLWNTGHCSNSFLQGVSLE